MCNGEEGSFRVLVENEACGIVGRRCAKAVTIFYQGGLIVMQDGEVKSSHQRKNCHRWTLCNKQNKNSYYIFMHNFIILSFWFAGENEEACDARIPGGDHTIWSVLHSAAGETNLSQLGQGNSTAGSHLQHIQGTNLYLH